MFLFIKSAKIYLLLWLMSPDAFDWNVDNVYV